MERSWRFLTDDGYLSSRSYQLFQRAIAAGNQQFQQAAPHLLAKQRGYLLLDVDVARRLGIAPIPRFENRSRN
jgi:hypothetical protein